MLDAIVVGAGPAGATAAERLARGGARLVLLDKARLPRAKACGGGIAAGGERVLDWDIAPLAEHLADSILWRYRGGRDRPVRVRPHITMVSRPRFDLHLVERAVAAGRGAVELRDGVAVEHVEEQADRVAARLAGGETIQARYLVGADGATGRTARALGLGRRTPAGVAIDSEIEATPEVWAREAGRATIDFACVPNGYGWIFPKGDVLACGVGCWGRADRLPRALDAFLTAALPPGGVLAERRLGHPVPLHEGMTPIATRRVCLAGDAASLVDPIMGEGIRFALRSGQIAADTILAALAGAAPVGDETGCLSYQQAVDTEIRADFELLRRFILPIFLRDPSMFYRSFFEQDVNYLTLARRLGALTRKHA